MKKLTYLLIVPILLLAFANPIYARIGVGVGSGKIQVDEILKPGIIYQLPSISVSNTGDVESEYALSIMYHEKQPEIRPSRDWFKFSPEKFNLKPGETKVVKITLDLPLKAKPGEYFAYLEASPYRKSQQGGATVGIAAAAKLYFTIEPANLLMGIYYKVISLWQIYTPWSQRIAIGLGLGIMVLIGRKYINIELKPRKSNVSK